MRVCYSGLPSGAGILRQDYPATRPGSLSPRLGGVRWACCHICWSSRGVRRFNLPRGGGGAPTRLGGSLGGPPPLGALRCGRRPATPGSAESGRVDGRWGGAWRPPWCRRAWCRGGMGLPPPEADRRWTIATPVQVPLMRVPAGSGLCSSPCPRALIRLGFAPRRAPPRVVLTSMWPNRVLALISVEDSRPT